jgi:predicted hotdog family 3-hydroxylacyl-ACP dehydratase
MVFDLKAVMAHKPPMLLVDDILEAGEDTAVTAFKIKGDNIFLKESGLLARTALIEIMAQSLAAMNAYKAYKNGKAEEKGFLVMLKDIAFYGDAFAGEDLICRVEVSDVISQTYIARCAIYKEETALARGELRIFSFG